MVPALGSRAVPRGVLNLAIYAHLARPNLFHGDSTPQAFIAEGMDSPPEASTTPRALAPTKLPPQETLGNTTVKT